MDAEARAHNKGRPGVFLEPLPLRGLTSALARGPARSTRQTDALETGIDAVHLALEAVDEVGLDELRDAADHALERGK